MPTNVLFDIKPILDSEKLIESIFNKAMKAASTGGFQSRSVTPVTKTRRTEAKRVLTCAKLLRDRLDEIVLQFPILDDLPKFYFDTIDLLIGIENLKKILGSLQGTNKVIWRIYREQTSIIWHSNVLGAKQSRRAAFSRFQSTIKKLNKRFMQLENLRAKIRKMPFFNFENPIVVIAGFPNVGKSSFLRSVTNANPEIAEYPFTTKNVSVGHYIDKDRGNISWQIVDTPGILDRSLENRNEIELKAFIAISSLPNVVLFIYDPTQENSLDNQKHLYQELKDKISVKIVFALNKIDLLTKIEIELILKDLEESISLNKQEILLLQAKDQEYSKNVMKKLAFSIVT